MAIAFISFSYYVRLNSNSINSPDVDFDNLNSVMDNITKLTFYETDVIDVSLEKIDLSDAVPVAFLMIAEIAGVHSISSLNKTMLTYFNTTNVKDKSNFTYPMVTNLHQSNLSNCETLKHCSIPSCATLFLPTKMIPSVPDLSSYSSCSPAPVPNMKQLDSYLYLSSQIIKHNNDAMNMTFHLPATDYQFYIRLTPEAINIISIRLMNSSYILFIAVLVVLIFGFIKSGKSHHYKDPRQPLI